MDNAESILTERVSPILSFGQIDKPNLEAASEREKKQAAKDFESLLLNHLLDEMKDTIGSWGYEKDGASTQIQGIFWMYLARDIANNGGIGIWEDIYKTLQNNGPAGQVEKSMDDII
ncbi:MAG: hypothetical protein JW715_15230 [Sedimentisphaerales bacterium]|nr:hypothetical protein [Sedimentisphaerales bacterium]